MSGSRPPMEVGKPNSGSPMSEPSTSIAQKVRKNDGLVIGELKGNLIMIEAARARRDFAPPAPVKLFVGRDAEIKRVATELRARKTVLIHGLSGVGKTALSRTVGTLLDTNDAFGDRIIWLDDLGVAPVDIICDTIASLLGDEQIGKLPSIAKRPATRALLAAHPDHLLVLDYVANVEAATIMLERIIPSRLAVLMTSQHLMASFDVDICLPMLDAEQGVQLFSQVAGVASDERIARICTAWENHPYALVLAASRVANKELSLDDLCASLDDQHCLKFLPSLMSSLHLSYDALTPPQQLVFTRLAACFGRKTRLKLLAKVCGLELIDCIDIVGELVARSLVTREGELVTMPRVVQDFGRAVLEQMLDPVQEQVLTVVEQLVQTHSSDQSSDHAAVEADLDNVLSAARYALERFPCDRGLDLAKALTWPRSGVLGRRGYWTELIAVGSAALVTAETCHNDPAWARFAFNTAIIHHRRGEHEAAEALYQRSAALFQLSGEQQAFAAVLHSLGMLALDRGQYANAQTQFENSLAIKEQLPGKPVLARTLHELGRLATARGDFGTALLFFEQSLSHRDPTADALGIALNRYAQAVIAVSKGELGEADALLTQSYTTFVQQNAVAELAAAERLRGNLARTRGAFAEALDQYASSLKRAQSLGDRGALGAISYEQGRLALMQHDTAVATTLLGESLVLRQALGDQAGIADVLYEQGRLALELGDTSKAADLLQQSWLIYEQLPDHTGLADVLREQGRLALEQGDTEAARRLLQDSLDRSTALGLKLGRARTLLLLCRLGEKVGDAVQAQQCCAESLRLFEQIGAFDVEQARQACARLNPAPS